MPGAKRRVDPGLIERLREQPYRFEFFQAVRILLAWHRRHLHKGGQDLLGRTIRFRSSVSLAFPPSEIESLTFDMEPCDRREDSPFSGVTLTPACIGLTGPSGVLPRHYTQQVAEREMYHRDTAARAFLDMFSTRAISLFYRAWLRSRLGLQQETPDENRFLPMLLSLAGLGLPGLRDRLSDGAGGISDVTLAYYAGALRARPASLHWFARIVADHFGVACRTEHFVGQWISLPADEYARLGAANCRLGGDAFCGASVWDRQGRVRVVIGPLRSTRFAAFLPDSDAGIALARLFRLIAGSILECEVRLLLDRRDIAPATLRGGPEGTRLGWSGWLGAYATERSVSDAAYLLKA